MNEVARSPATYFAIANDDASDRRKINERLSGVTKTSASW